MNFLRNLFRKDTFIIIAIYTAAHGLILLNKGVFADDWVLYGVDKKIIINRFIQTGNVLIGYFHSFLLSFKNGIVFYRILIFSAYLLSALSLNSVLKNVKKIDATSK